MSPRGSNDGERVAVLQDTERGDRALRVRDDRKPLIELLQEWIAWTLRRRNLHRPHWKRAVDRVEHKPTPYATPLKRRDKCVAAGATIQCMRTLRRVNRLFQIVHDKSGHAVVDNLIH